MCTSDHTKNDVFLTSKFVFILSIVAGGFTISGCGFIVKSCNSNNFCFNMDTSSPITGPKPRRPLRSKPKDVSFEENKSYIPESAKIKKTSPKAKDVTEEKDERSDSEDSENQGSSSEESDIDEDTLETSTTSQKHNRSQQKQAIRMNTSNFSHYSVIVIVAIFIGAIGLFINGQEPIDSEKYDINQIKDNFPTQDASLWMEFESGVNDVVTQHRPSTFILLYKEDAAKTVEELLASLAKFALCNITGCNKKAIELSPTDLNAPEVVKDYGILIEDYGDKLRENGVMVVTNLEEVRGTSAQAFHSFCDEFTPLVHKSLFIFTMKVNDFPESSDIMRFVEDYLRDKWSDLKGDTVNALITRLTSMVVVIRPEIQTGKSRDT